MRRSCILGIARLEIETFCGLHISIIFLRFIFVPKGKLPMYVAESSLGDTSVFLLCISIRYAVYEKIDWQIALKQKCRCKPNNNKTKLKQTPPITSDDLNVYVFLIYYRDLDLHNSWLPSQR